MDDGSSGREFFTRAISGHRFAEWNGDLESGLILKNQHNKVARALILAMLLLPAVAAADVAICIFNFGPCTIESKDKARHKDTDKAHDMTTVGSEVGAQVEAEGAKSVITGAQTDIRQEPDK